MVTRKEAQERTASHLEMPPTTDATIAAGIDQLGEKKQLRVLANLRDEEALIVSIGVAWADHLNDPTKSFFEGFFNNLTVYSAARPKRGGFARLQITSIAQAHAGANVEAKEGRMSRFLKAIGAKSD
jgi:hypothetical protein